MKILIIDDNPDDVSLIVRQLQSLAEEIESTDDAKEGIAKATDDHYDCIILDHLMPHESGLEVLKSLRDKGINSPVVLVTGCHDRLLATRCIQEGAQNYFPKEFIDKEPDLFRDCVSKTVNLQFLEANARLSLLDAQVRMIESRLNGNLRTPAVREAS